MGEQASAIISAPQWWSNVLNPTEMKSIERLHIYIAILLSYEEDIFVQIFGTSLGEKGGKSAMFM